MLRRDETHHNKILNEVLYYQSLAIPSISHTPHLSLQAMSENGSRRRPNSFVPEEVDGFSTVSAPTECDLETPELAPWQSEMLDSGLRRDEEVEEKPDNL